MKRNRVVKVLPATLLAAVVTSVPVAAEPRPLQIGRADVLPVGTTEFFADAAYEVGRESRVPGGGPGPGAGDGADYNNLRLGPVGAAHGVDDGLEIGAYFVFVNNSEDDDGAPDESGLQGITGFMKLALNAHAALEVGVRAGGEDDVAPYPSDGLDFYVNLPMRRSLGAGLLYGEVGYTVQDNDIGGSYANWGVGYAHPMGTGFHLNVELKGDEAPVAPGNHMDLLFGALLDAGEIRLRPYLGLGLYDASPDITLGMAVTLRM